MSEKNRGRDRNDVYQCNAAIQPAAKKESFFFYFSSFCHDGCVFVQISSLVVGYVIT